MWCFDKIKIKVSAVKNNYQMLGNDSLLCPSSRWIGYNTKCLKFIISVVSTPHECVLSVDLVLFVFLLSVSELGVKSFVCVRSLSQSVRQRKRLCSDCVWCDNWSEKTDNFLNITKVWLTPHTSWLWSFTKFWNITFFSMKRWSGLAELDAKR